MAKYNWFDEMERLEGSEIDDSRPLYMPDDPPKYHFNPITSRMPILNALSGEPCVNSKGRAYRIGSRDELRFYVVIRGEPGNPKEACKLFFDSPEQFERATGIAVSRESKQRFRTNQTQFK